MKLEASESLGKLGWIESETIDEFLSVLSLHLLLAGNAQSAQFERPKVGKSRLVSSISFKRSTSLRKDYKLNLATAEMSLLVFVDV